VLPLDELEVGGPLGVGVAFGFGPAFGGAFGVWPAFDGAFDLAFGPSFGGGALAGAAGSWTGGST